MFKAKTRDLTAIARKSTAKAHEFTVGAVDLKSTQFAFLGAIFEQNGSVGNKLRR
jgi:hypothetical protein